MVKLEKIFIITGAGIRIWELIDGQRNVEMIKREIIEEFEVGSKKAEEDLIMFLKELEKRGCIKEVKNEKE